MMGYGNGWYGMWGYGWLWMLIFAALIVVPFWRLLPRFGIPAWISLVAIIPFGALVLLWIIAFKDDVGGGSDSA